ncbi:MAG: PDZ domain-containing protein [Pyrinomonadaceae bacterium]|nr:PDZ domain-containing protein [Pyrinomonadaceae bacterium]
MVRRSVAFILFAAAASVAVIGQTPEAKPAPVPPAAPAPRVMAFSFDGNSGYLGVQTVDVNSQNYASFGLSGVRGVAVEKVMDGSPAEKAQLQKGDVIVRFNGEEVTSARKLTRMVGEVAPDHQVTLTVVRSGSEREVPVTIAKRPAPAFGEMGFPGGVEVPMPEIPEFRGEMPQVRVWPRAPRGEGGDVLMFRRGSRRIGVSVTPLTKQLADHFGVKGGVMISEVRENSPAAKADLKAGDIIVEVDGKEVASDADVVRAISEKKEGDVTLTVVRKGDRKTFSVTPEESKEVFEHLIGPDGPVPSRPMRPAQPAPLNQLLDPWWMINWPSRSGGRAIIAPRF